MGSTTVETTKTWTEIDEGIRTLRNHMRDLEAALRDEAFAAKLAIHAAAEGGAGRDAAEFALDMVQLAEQHAGIERDLGSLNAALLALGTVSTLAEGVESHHRWAQQEKAGN